MDLRLLSMVCFGLIYSGVNCSPTTVNTNVGELIGEQIPVTFKGESYTVDRYLGIPYAQPPVGELRFQKPQPVKPFEKPFDATKFGASCPQHDLLTKGPNPFQQSEDCLFLNVYVPNEKSDKETGHAVMFFIHGGGFTMGTANYYNGEILSGFGNVIVVAINYRIGLFGFLDLNDDRARGNFGLWDQRQALLWVNQNIESFGGDKNRVTIFGESAGAMSVTAQMLYPPNKGLFQNAIAESGTVAMSFLFPEDTYYGATGFADGGECAKDTADDMINCFLDMTGEQPIEIIKTTMANEGMHAMAKFSTVPSIDGEFIKTKPLDLMKAALEERVEEIEFARTINLINGMNEAEGALTLMMHGTAEELEGFQATREQMNTQFIPQALFFGLGGAPPEVVTKMIISEYTDWSGPDDPLKLRHQLIRLNGDIYMNVPGTEFSLMHSNGSDAASFLYDFRAVVNLSVLPNPSWLNKANHGDEVGPVFGYNFDFKMMMNMTEEYQVPAKELDLSSRMMTYWSNFAKTSNPNLPVVNNDGSTPWSQYTVDEQRYTILDYEDSTGQFLYARETDFWRNILPAVLDIAKESNDKPLYSEDQGVCEKDGDC